jgi:hypothetical protein
MAGAQRPTEPDWTLHTIDLSPVPPGDRHTELVAHAERLQRSLDLAAGPLLRAALVHSGPDGADRLLIVAHHLVTDGVSWRIILTDLFAAYRELAAGTRSPRRSRPRPTRAGHAASPSSPPADPARPKSPTGPASRSTPRPAAP